MTEDNYMDIKDLDSIANGTNKTKKSQYKNPESQLHAGHRGRMRDKIRKGGIDSLPDHEILEYLLYATNPRNDVNGLAHRLINKFGSFFGVFQASEAELREVDGCSDNTALFLSSYTQIYNRYLQSRDSKLIRLTNTSKITQFVNDRIGNLAYEVLMVVSLDVNSKVISTSAYTSKSLSTVTKVSIDEISKTAIRANTKRVILAHNHPSGGIDPSKQDLIFTSELNTRLKTLGITLIESVIVSFGKSAVIPILDTKELKEKLSPKTNTKESTLEDTNTTTKLNNMDANMKEIYDAFYFTLPNTKNSVQETVSTLDEDITITTEVFDGDDGEEG